MLDLLAKPAGTQHALANLHSLTTVQAVPVAEPEWSAAYKGLCLFMAKVLQPVWEEEFMGSPALKANTSHHSNAL